MTTDAMRKKHSFKELFDEACKTRLRFGKFYHFYRNKFGNFFAIFTLDFTPTFMVKCCCFQKLPNFTNYNKEKGDIKWKTKQKF